MGSARAAGKEFEQLKGSLGSGIKSADTASSTMGQSFRAASAGSSGIFGQATSQSQSAGGQFAPMSAGLGSLSSTGPVQCAKKKDTPKHHASSGEMVQSLLKLEGDDRLEAMANLYMSNGGDHFDAEEDDAVSRMIKGHMRSKHWVDDAIFMRAQKAKDVYKLRKNYQDKDGLSADAQFAQSPEMMDLSKYTMLGQRIAASQGVDYEKFRMGMTASGPDLYSEMDRLNDLDNVDYAASMSPEDAEAYHLNGCAAMSAAHDRSFAMPRPWEKESHFRRWLKRQRKK